MSLIVGIVLLLVAAALAFLNDIDVNTIIAIGFFAAAVGFLWAGRGEIPR